MSYRTLVAATLIFIGCVTSSCSKKEESPDPVSKQQNQDPNTPNNPNDPPPPPPIADTTSLFTQDAWITRKVYKDGVEQAGSFLIDASYKFNTPNAYFFSIPNLPSASGNWTFDVNTKSKVVLSNQGGTQVWTILSINANALTIEEDNAGVIYKHEFTH